MMSQLKLVYALAKIILIISDKNFKTRQVIVVSNTMCTLISIRGGGWRRKVFIKKIFLNLHYQCGCAE